MHGCARQDGFSQNYLDAKYFSFDLPAWDYVLLGAGAAEVQMEKKQRSPAYPSMSLREAVDRVGALHKVIGTHATSREMVAKGLGYSSLSGASATTISAINKYGLIEGRGDDVKVSDRAMAILHPHSDAERRQALRDAALEPDLFRELHDRFPGDTPNADLLRNYLLRNRFSAEAAQTAVLAYRETIEFVADAAGGYDSVPQPSEVGPENMQASTQPVAAAAKNTVLYQQIDERRLGRWDFEDGGYVEIRATAGVDTEDALDMVQTLIDLRRKELERKRREPQEGTK